MQQYALHWFRRDLRVAGNPALTQVRESFSGAVLGFFCFDPTFLARSDFSANRFAFFLETLIALRQELRDTGGDLLVRDQGPQDAFRKLFSELGPRKRPQVVSFNRDYEPFARKRDEEIERLLQKEYGCEVRTDRDHLLIEPAEMERSGGGHYRIYTPFQRKWLEVFRSDVVKERISLQRNGWQYLQALKRGERPKLFRGTWSEKLPRSQEEDLLARYRDQNAARTQVALPAAGSLAAFAQVERFSERISDYSQARDIPSVPGTSHFSIYFKNGSLTVAQAIAALDLRSFKKGAADGPSKFLAELVWREFYYHILWHHPQVETGPFDGRYATLPWENREDLFEAWKEGRTGFPIVDAGMRQLLQTGWMHNRVRMIVASFLTKDLLIDWRHGERHFMNLLLDGDLAPNNGGWQWAASTGCDPQPYFRIFNPYLQSKKFDPKGEYIRRYVPELKNVPASRIHREDVAEGTSYPRPIVDHAEQRNRVLAMYRELRARTS